MVPENIEPAEQRRNYELSVDLLSSCVMRLKQICGPWWGVPEDCRDEAAVLQDLINDLNVARSKYADRIAALYNAKQRSVSASSALNRAGWGGVI
jgi:hypothetical protein